MQNKGFTLVEILIVISIIVFLSSSALFSSFVMREQLQFRSGYNSLEGIISEARTMSLSGESYPDEYDYDGDGLSGEDDYILPNGYIVQLVDDGVNITAYLYADLFNSVIDSLDPDDQLLKKVELPENIRLKVNARSKSGGVVGGLDTDNVTFMYKTPDATFSVIDTASVQILSLQLEIDQTAEDDETDIKRSKYIFLHYLYGIPELLNESFFEPDEG